jgi:CBS domain containing-hemolysin-like protein
MAGLGFCLIVLAFTSAVDTAFTSVSWRRLNAILAEQSRKSHVLSQLINDPYGFKATLILLNTSATIAAAAFTLYLTDALSIWGQTASLALLVFVILIVSAALPKALAARDPEASVLALAGPVSLVAFLLSPLISVVSLLTLPLAKLVGSQSMTRTPLVFEEELRMLVHAGEEAGFVEHEEREMIEGIFSFSDTIVREVMVPRVDVIALDAETTLEEALGTVINEGHSRIPVYEETIDHIIGILYAKDLLPALRDNQRQIAVTELLRPVHYVPETLNVDALLKDLQKTKVHIAIVVDEHGGMAGLVTIEDLIEEIVGEIQDEYDTEDPSIEVVNDTELIVHARTLIYDLNELTGLHLEATESDRVGGLVYEHLGRVPKVGDEVVLDQATIKVLSITGVRPQKLHIVYQPEELDYPSPALSHPTRERDDQHQDEATEEENPDELLAQLLASPDLSGETRPKTAEEENTNGRSPKEQEHLYHADSRRTHSA